MTTTSPDAPDATDLTRLFNPRSIALVGASDRPDSIGARTLANLLDHSTFDGELYLVNATRTTLRDRPCYPSIDALPATPDVAMVVVPASAALAVLEQCAARGVRFAVVLTSGFGEVDDAGRAVEAEMKRIAARSGMRIYGPNCPGVCNVTQRIGMTFSPSFPFDLVPGPLGIATQGGGLGRNIMQAMDRGIGVAVWSSSGNEVDLQVADFVRYMADAPDVKVIVALVEGFKDGARFVDAARRAAENDKPIVLLKVGRSEYGQRAAASHTASITGSAEVNSAILRQLGVIEVDDIDELVDVSWLLTRARPPAVDEIAIYCSSGGAAALTADLVGQAGVRLATFDATTTASLAAKLPAYAAIGNPIDTTAMVLTDRELVDQTLLAVCEDPNVALVLFPVTIDYGDVTVRLAESVVRVQAKTATPIVPIWMTDRIGSSFPIYCDAGIVPSKSIGKAVKAVRRWLDHGRWHARADRLDWRPLATRLHDRGEAHALGEAAAKALLARAGLPMPKAEVATTRDDAIAAARRCGPPVVAKIASADIVHKSDVGGVALGLVDDAAVGAAWDRVMASVARHAPDARIDGLLVESMAAPGGVEVLVGVSFDAVFGHVMTFGFGGVHVELFGDVARRPLPVSPAEAAAMVREIRAFPLLDGHRNAPKADVDALVALLVGVSDFVAAHADDVDELELNPVWVGPSGRGVLVLDAVLRGRLSAPATVPA